MYCNNSNQNLKNFAYFFLDFRKVHHIDYDPLYSSGQRVHSGSKNICGQSHYDVIFQKALWIFVSFSYETVNYVSGYAVPVGCSVFCGSVKKKDSNCDF